MLRTLLILTFALGWATQAADAPWIVYEAMDASLHVTDATGTFDRALDVPHPDVSGAGGRTRWWDVHARALVYVDTSSQINRLVRHDLATGDEVVLANCRDWCSSPNIGPDGILVAYSQSSFDEATNTDTRRLHIAETYSGTDVTIPIDGREINLFQTFWLPDGETLLINGTDSDLRINARTNEAEQLTIEVNTWLHLADDGASIIGDYFRESPSDFDAGGVFRYDIASATFTRLTDTSARGVIPGLTFLRWVDDPQAGGIYRLTEAGAVVPVFEGTTTADSPIRWNDDETLLLFARRLDDVSLLHVYDTTNDTLTQLTHTPHYLARWAER